MYVTRGRVDSVGPSRVPVRDLAERARSVTRAGAAAQWGFLRLGLLRSEKKRLVILSDLSSALAPGRFTLLLGPPASGKSTLLKLLAGKLQRPEGLDVRARQPCRACGAPARGCLARGCWPEPAGSRPLCACSTLTYPTLH